MIAKILFVVAALVASMTATAQSQTASAASPVYLVIYQTVTDQPRFDRYVAAVTPVIERSGGKLLAAGEPEVLEGHTDYQRVAVFIWPSREELTRFWNSNEYARIHQLREGAAEWLASVVPSVPGAKRTH